MGIKENSRPKPYTPDSRTPKHLYPNENGFVPDVFGYLRYNIGNLLYERRRTMDLTSLAGQQAAIFQQDFTKDEAPLSFAHTNAL